MHTYVASLISCIYDTIGSTLQVPRILIIIGLVIGGSGCIFLGPPGFLTEP